MVRIVRIWRRTLLDVNAHEQGRNAHEQGRNAHEQGRNATLQNV